MLTVVATMNAKPGKEKETEDVLKGLLEPTRAEEGCIQYDMHRDNNDPSLFLFYENWESTEHLERHLKTPHLRSFFEKEADLLAGPVKLYRMTKMP